jgi:choline dehydrogenase
MAGGLSHPKSRGRIQLTGPNPHDRLHIEANMLGDLEDLKTAIACVELCREIGNAPALRDFLKREAMPGKLKGAALETFIRDAATTYWHPCGTAKMGHDGLSVVDNSLKVYGVDNLRIADASILPHLTTGNTMAACVVIGERAAAMISAEHSL